MVEPAAPATVSSKRVHAALLTVYQDAAWPVILCCIQVGLHCIKQATPHAATPYS